MQALLLFSSLTMSVLLTALPAVAESPPELASAEADSTRDRGSSLRGTTKPLPRNANALQWVGRAVLIPAWVLGEIVSWPAEKTFEGYHRSTRLRTAIHLFTAGVEIGQVRLEAVANYESGEIAPELGLKATRDEWLGESGSLSLKGAWFSDDLHIADLRWHTPENRIRFELRGTLEADPDRDFFGLGPNAPDEPLEFNRRRHLVEATVSARLLRQLCLEATGYGRSIDLNISEEDQGAVTPPLLNSFAISRESDYLGGELALEWDTRDNGAGSQRGIFLRGMMGMDQAQSEDDSDYERISVEAQSYLTLPGIRRTIVLRAFAAGMQADDPSRLPFVELERIGGRQGPRGYERDRFTDLKQLVLTAEYRYRASGLIDGAVFLDWGTVSPKWETLRLASTTPSGGFGILLGENKTTALQVAFSEEGVLFTFGGDSMFGPSSRRLR